jgi:hypothetical protein|nr:MAG TPA: YopX protein [Caudoviricetes sp.]
MRTIKFKGKSLEDGEWNYGDLSHVANQTLVKNNPCRDKRPVFTFAVAPDTVGQYTGFLDKDGKEVYEGDILRYNNSTFAVEWSEDLGAFTLRPIREKGKCDDIPLGVILKYIRFIIIGNIHDKQEGGEDAGNNDNI